MEKIDITNMDFKPANGLFNYLSLDMVPEITEEIKNNINNKQEIIEKYKGALSHIKSALYPFHKINKEVLMDDNENYTRLFLVIVTKYEQSLNEFQKNIFNSINNDEKMDIVIELTNEAISIIEKIAEEIK